MLMNTAQDLIRGGELKVFTPMMFYSVCLRVFRRSQRYQCVSFFEKRLMPDNLALNVLFVQFVKP